MDEILVTIDVSVISNGTQFCEDFGYEYIPIHMIQVNTQFENALYGRPQAKCAHEPLTCGMPKYLYVARNSMVMHKKENQGAIQKGENEVE